MLALGCAWYRASTTTLTLRRPESRVGHSLVEGWPQPANNFVEHVVLYNTLVGRLLTLHTHRAIIDSHNVI